MKLLTACVVVTLLNLTGGSQACECGAPLTPEEAYQAATAVFAGTVLLVMDAGPDCGDTKTILMSVDSCWKGGVPLAPELTTVYTYGNEACCGFTFDQGVSHLVYAFSGLGGLVAALCTRTTPLSAAAEDLAFLGEPGSGCTLPVENETWGAIKSLYDR